MATTMIITISISHCSLINYYLDKLHQLEHITIFFQLHTIYSMKTINYNNLCPGEPPCLNVVQNINLTSELPCISSLFIAYGKYPKYLLNGKSSV